ncbi:MAG: hypothetical protein UIM53_03570 [Acutalibacteraceae bacterium]|nr:hypothetical protein [Acutalibacteraceae bacterium]
MIKENILLNMSDVGLGNLTEYQLLIILANYHSLSLVDGKDNTPNEIVDSFGRLLYPAYYMTHLKVPVTNFIENFGLWDKIDVNVDVKRFGSNILDSEYVFKRSGDKNNAEKTVVMNSNSLFVVDATLDKSVNRISSIPKPEFIADLNKVKKVPDSLKIFKEIRKSGFVLQNIIDNYIFSYTIVKDRDVSYNHGVIFAKFIEIMDMCQNKFLFGADNLRLPKNLYPYIHTIERETYYYSNCFEGDTVKCNMNISFEPCERRNMTDNCKEITPFWIIASFELFNQNTNNLIVISKVKKIVCIPLQDSILEYDINRIIFQKYGDLFQS